MCQSTDHKLSGLISKITGPLYNEEDNVSLMYAAVGLLASWILLPVVGVAYTATVLKNTKSMYSNLDALRIAESLMHSVDFNKFIPEEERYVAPVYDSSEVEEAIAEKRAALESADPQHLVDLELKEYNTTEGTSYCGDLIKNIQQKAKNLYDTLIDDLETRYNEAKELIDKEMSNITRLGDTMSKSAVLNTRFQLGIDDTGLPVYKDIGMTNINFVGTYSKDLISVLKVFWINML